MKREISTVQAVDAGAFDDAAIMELCPPAYVGEEAYRNKGDRMRKLLEEAAKVLTDARFNAMQGPLSEGQKAMIDGWAELRSRITATLSAPEPDAEALATAIIEAQHASNTYRDWVLNAAALIESHSKRVPRAMLEKAYLAGVNGQCFFPGEHAEKFGYTVIGPSVTEADKHGVKVEG